LFDVFRKSSKDRRELLRYEVMTGLSDRQLTDLVVRVHAVCAQKFISRGRPHALGLYRSVAMVVCLLRKNPTQDFVGAVFGVSQPTVSRRWNLLRPVIGDVLAEVIPTPREVVGRGTVLVDGTVCPTWDWHDVPELYSAKVGFAGMNLQVAATLDGDLVAVGPIPVPGARHDAHVFAASGLADLLADCPTIADLGYVGVEGIDTVPFKRLPGNDLYPSQIEFNTALSKMRAAVEHAIAHLKTWRMLSEESGRYRAPIGKDKSVVKAVVGLFFFAAYE
jgi:DDE superfamily endonuclease/Helix-turn-helix of DDE superfamily endonuclease